MKKSTLFQLENEKKDSREGNVSGRMDANNTILTSDTFRIDGVWPCNNITVHAKEVLIDGKMILTGEDNSIEATEILQVAPGGSIEVLDGAKLKINAAYFDNQGTVTGDCSITVMSDLMNHK